MSLAPGWIRAGRDGQPGQLGGRRRALGVDGAAFDWGVVAGRGRPARRARRGLPRPSPRAPSAPTSARSRYGRAMARRLIVLVHRPRRAHRRGERRGQAAHQATRSAAGWRAATTELAIQTDGKAQPDRRQRRPPLHGQREAAARAQARAQGRAVQDAEAPSYKPEVAGLRRHDDGRSATAADPSPSIREPRSRSASRR